MGVLDDIAHLRAQASTDLARPSRDALLDWAFYAAHFSGQVAAANEALAFLEHMWRDAKSAVSGRFGPDPTDPRTADALREMQSLLEQIGRHRSRVAVWQEMLRASELTASLLERRQAEVEQINDWRE